MTPKVHKRRLYLIDPAFQYGLIRKISMIAVLIIVMSFSFLAIIHQFYGDVQVEVVQPDPFSRSNSVVAPPVQTPLLTLIWPVLLICVVAALVITFLYGVVISHRMAGPIFRIRNVLTQMAQGDLSQQVRLRRKDDFKALAESVNGLIINWRLQLIELKRLCQDLESEATTKQIEHLSRCHEILSTFKVE